MARWRLGTLSSTLTAQQQEELFAFLLSISSSAKPGNIVIEQNEKDWLTTNFPALAGLFEQI